MTDVVVTQYLATWRSAVLGGRLYIEGRVAPEHDGPSPTLAGALRSWDGHHYWDRGSRKNGAGGSWLVLVREMRAPRERWWLHGLLLMLTLLTTSVAGVLLRTGGDELWVALTITNLMDGAAFALPLLAILCAHESGHFLVARRYRVNASPPYFVPFPAQINVLGTMGAFIRLRSPLFDRRTLFDIGAAGPLAGLLIAVPVLLAGLAISAVAPGMRPAPFSSQFVVFVGAPLFIGDSILLLTLRAIVAPDGVLLLHPLAMAGWVGILVTMLNLLPLAQLDGGHITYALFGARQRLIARVAWVVLLLLGWLWWGWWLWAVLALVIGRGRLEHPRVVSPDRGLDRARTALGLVTLALLVLTFMPVPVAVPTPLP